ncbi:MAG: hypothetical protein KGL39_11945 [Patescibacteria group bacterium]|nr:hypothetical protein [Patescibacteria group bacterium]
MNDRTTSDAAVELVVAGAMVMFTASLLGWRGPRAQGRALKFLEVVTKASEKPQPRAIQAAPDFGVALG